MLNIEQTKLVGLTMELELKAKEYKVLCNQLDKLKAEKMDPNDKKLMKLKNSYHSQPYFNLYFIIIIFIFI